MAKPMTKDQREEFARQAWDLHILRGWSYQKIASHLSGLGIDGYPSINHSTVLRWVGKIKEANRERFRESAEEHKAEQVAQLRRIAQEAYEGWLRTCEAAVTERTNTKEAGVKPGPGGAAGEGSEATGDEDDDEAFGSGSDTFDSGPIPILDAATQLAAEEAGIVLTITERRTSRETKWQAGDPAMLAQFRGALADIRSILGLDAPKAEASAAEVVIKFYGGERDWSEVV